MHKTKVKAIVSEYETKPVNENWYEAHKKFIDIQYLLKGREKNFTCYNQLAVLMYGQLSNRESLRDVVFAVQAL